MRSNKKIKQWQQEDKTPEATKILIGQ